MMQSNVNKATGRTAHRRDFPTTLNTEERWQKAGD